MEKIIDIGFLKGTIEVKLCQICESNTAWLHKLLPIISQYI